MNRSGAGKTSLLNVISRRNTRNDGLVTANGQPIVKSFSRVASFVQQEDLFLGSLTVREHLLYQARLRLGDSVPSVERARRVEALISSLGLGKCANNVIGALAMGKTRYVAVNL